VKALLRALCYGATKCIKNTLPECLSPSQHVTTHVFETASRIVWISTYTRKR